MIVVYYLHSDFRSVVGWIVNEYLKAIDMYGGKYPESMSWNICELELRDRLMTIEQRNIDYKEIRREVFRENVCYVCPHHIGAAHICEQTTRDIDYCMVIEEERDREIAGWYDD